MIVIFSVTEIDSPPVPSSGAVVVEVLDGVAAVVVVDATNCVEVLVIGLVDVVDDSVSESCPLHPTSAIASKNATRRFTVATPGSLTYPVVNEMSTWMSTVWPAVTGTVGERSLVVNGALFSPFVQSAGATADTQSPTWV